MPMYEISEEMKLRLQKSFTFHPTSSDQAKRYATIREAGYHFAVLIGSLTPPSREQSLSYTAIEEAVMRAYQAIAVNEA